MRQEKTVTTPAQAQAYIAQIKAKPSGPNRWSIKQGGVETTVVLSPAGPNRVTMMVTQVPCVC